MHKRISTFVVSLLLLAPTAVFAQATQSDTANFKSTEAARMDNVSAEPNLGSTTQPYGQWSLKPEHMPPARTCDGPSVQVKCDNSRIDFQARKDPISTPEYKVTDAYMRESRQKMLDSFIDDKLGGIGKVEFRGAGYEGRFEYGYTTRCKSRGRTGVCLSIKF